MALAEVFEAFAGPDAPVEFAAYDGSHAGAAGAPVKITVRSPVAVAYLAQAPGGLGLARAYVAGQLDVEGDMYEALSRMTKTQAISMGPAEKWRLLQALGGPKLLLHRIPPPPQEVQISRRWLTGQAALEEPRRQRDLAPLRRLQPVLRVGARAQHGVHLRLLPARGRHPGGGAGRQVRPGRAQAGAA